MAVGGLLIAYSCGGSSISRLGSFTPSLWIPLCIVTHNAHPFGAERGANVAYFRYSRMTQFMKRESVYCVSSLENFSVSHVEHYGQVTDILRRARIEMFDGRMAPEATAPDIEKFDNAYLSATGSMLMACSADGVTAGTIGYRAYDQRFTHVRLTGSKIVEVARLYIAPHYRRQGLARRLFLQLKQQARSCGVDTLYLHTHPFLPGALEFWESVGFHIIVRDEDPIWQTIHMVFYF